LLGLVLVIVATTLSNGVESSEAVGEEPEAGHDRYARASPLRWGKRAPLRWGKRAPLRWGKRDADEDATAAMSPADSSADPDEYVDVRQLREAPLRWGKRASPLRWGKRSNPFTAIHLPSDLALDRESLIESLKRAPLRWGKRASPMRRSLQLMLAYYPRLIRFGKRGSDDDLSADYYNAE